MSDWQWHELNSIDIDRSAAFYESTFGWNVEHAEYDGDPYKMLMKDGRPIGGVAPASDAGTRGWGVFISVEDCDQGREAVLTNGGNVLFGPIAVPGVGRIAGCSDPLGAEFTIIQPEPR